MKSCSSIKKMLKTVLYLVILSFMGPATSESHFPLVDIDAFRKMSTIDLEVLLICIWCLSQDFTQT